MTGPELRAWRDHWQLSQADLARTLGIHINTVHRWERETVPIPPYLELALAELNRRLGAALERRAKGPALTR